MTYQNYSLKQLQRSTPRIICIRSPTTRNCAAPARASSRAPTGRSSTIAKDNEILDGMAGLWCVNVGYGRDELAEAAYAQMKELPYYNSFFRCSTPTPVLLAQKIAEIAPANINQVFFGSSGSEANDTALRLVRHYWALEGKPEKNRIISRNMAYHGSTIAGASLGGMDRHARPARRRGAQHRPCHDALRLSSWRCPARAIMISACARRRPSRTPSSRPAPDKVAAFIGEPIKGAGGVKIPPASYWPEIQRICRKYDVLLMLDEVITGYGRTGEWFAAQTFGIEADTITTAKALTSGYQPLSALLVGDRIAATLVEKGGEFYHGYTYSGHPVACAVALKNLEIIEREGMVDRVRTDTGPYFAQALRERIAGHRWSARSGRSGCWARSRSSGTRRRESGSCRPDGGRRLVRDHAIANGMMLRATGDTMILSPPLIWTRATIDLACERIATALDLAERDLRK